MNDFYDLLSDVLRYCVSFFYGSASRESRRDVTSVVTWRPGESGATQRLILYYLYYFEFVSRCNKRQKHLCPLYALSGKKNFMYREKSHMKSEQAPS